MKYLMSMITLLITISIAFITPAIAAHYYESPNQPEYIKDLAHFPEEEMTKNIIAWLQEYPQLAKAIIDRQQSDKAELYKRRNQDFVLATFYDLYLHLRITKNEKNLFDNSDDGYIGDGEVIAVKFFNYNCDNTCNDSITAIQEYLKENPNKKVILKETPDTNPQNEYASKVALATKKIHGNDAYITIFKAFHTYTDNPIEKSEPLNKEVILKILTRHNFNVKSIMKSLNDHNIINQIENNRKLQLEIGYGLNPWYIFKGNPNSKKYKKHNAINEFVQPEPLDMNKVLYQINKETE